MSTKYWQSFIVKMNETIKYAAWPELTKPDARPPVKLNWLLDAAILYKQDGYIRT